MTEARGIFTESELGTALAVVCDDCFQEIMVSRRQQAS
jgi:hypothetical protein